MVSYFITVNGVRLGSIIGSHHEIIENDNKLVIMDKCDFIISIIQYNEISIENSKIESLKYCYDVKIKL